MARTKKYITRTIESTHIDVLGLNTETAEALRIDFTVFWCVTDEEKALKKLQKIVEEPEIRLVKILETQTHKQLYKISEEDFLKYATPVKGKETETNDSE